jgi:hypothetical protein
MVKMKLAAAAVLVAVLVAASVVYTLITIEKSQNIEWNDTLILKSFSPSTYGENITGGTLKISNPTERAFENLTLTIMIDDSQLITPYLRLLMPLSGEPPLSNYSVPIAEVSIEPYQNISLQVYLYNPEQNEPPFYNPSVTAQTYSPHVIAVYLSRNSFGDVIDGQTFSVQQQKAYLQIVGYSPVEHSEGTWHPVFNSSTQRYEYVNDQPNYLQKYWRSYYPLDNSSFLWAKAFNQIGENYFNITVYNNSTFPVNHITVTSATGGVANPLLTLALRPTRLSSTRPTSASLQSSRMTECSMITFRSELPLPMAVPESCRQAATLVPVFWTISSAMFRGTSS